MASKSFSEDDLSCPVCCDIFKNPVLMRCSHSICKECLERFWHSKGSRECPICRRKCGKGQPPKNLALKNLCESFIKDRKLEGHCSLHGKKLTLFCQEDNLPVCAVCRSSNKHNGHTCSPLHKAALVHKENLNVRLKPLRKKLRRFENAQLRFDQMAAHIKAQIEKTERQIKKEFEKLHQFLRDEEAARIAALREEEEQKSQMMKEKTEKMSGEISSLSDTIKAIEEQIGVDDLTFLQSPVHTAEPEPTKVSGPQIYVAKHLNNVSFRVWEKMQEIVKYTPVTLDPNTAHPDLILCEDLTCVRYHNEDHEEEDEDDCDDNYDNDDDYDEDDYDDNTDDNFDNDDNFDDDDDDGDDDDDDNDDDDDDDEDEDCDDSEERQQLPDNPERFNEELAVLGSEGFNSGTHCWEVKIKGDEDWAVGVMAESAQRKGSRDSSTGLWYVSREDGHYYACSAQRFNKHLRVRHRLKRIRVKLDCHKGNMAFTDPVHNTHLFTFTHIFTEKVFPYFNPDISMRILPTEVSVMVE